MLTVLILSLGVIVLLAVVVGMADSVASRNAWRRVAAERREQWARRHVESEFALVGGEIDRYWAVERRSAGSAMLLKLAEIETAASRTLDERLGPESRQFFQIRDELAGLGVWSNEDLATFDRAVALRSAIVHGDGLSGQGAKSVTTKDLDGLLAKLIG